MTVRYHPPAPEAVETPAERTSESRRRVDRSHSRGRTPETTSGNQADNQPAAPSRVSYTIERINVTPGAPAGKSGSAAAAQPQAESGQQAQPGQAGGAQGAGAPAGGEPAAEGALLGEGAQAPAAPEPGVTAEQVEARAQNMAAAQAALDNAEESPALMDAFASAPPTIKAQVSGDLGSRVSGTMSSETTALQENTPEITAEMNGNTPPPAGEITAPDATAIELEPAATEAEPDPEAVVGDPVRSEPGADANANLLARARASLAGATDNQSVAAQVAEDGLNNVQTTDPSIVTSPGSAPPVPQTGETDPQRFQNQQDEGSRQAQETLTAQQEQARALPGAERAQLADVHESLPVGDLTPPTAEDAAAPEGAQHYVEMNQPAEVQTAFDDIAGASMQASMADAQGQVQQAATDRDQQHTEAVNQAQSQAADAQRQADTDQQTHVSEARTQIEGQRQSTLEQQQTAVSDMQQQAEDRRTTDRASFDDRVTSDQAQLDDHYSQAETDAHAEVSSGEQQATDERDRAEREIGKPELVGSGSQLYHRPV